MKIDSNESVLYREFLIFTTIWGNLLSPKIATPGIGINVVRTQFWLSYKAGALLSQVDIYPKMQTPVVASARRDNINSGED
jgi:hypothetical protein